MQFLRKWHLQEVLKSRSSIGNFLGEVVGKDEIGPKPYGTIAGVTLPGFLSISYISFPLRTHSNPPPSDLNWCKKVKSDLLCSKRGTSQDERSPWLCCSSLFNPQMPRFPIFRVIKYSSSKFPMLVTESLKISPPSHICVFSIFAVFLTNYSYSR